MAQIGQLVKEADIILEVVDARFVELTRNKAIEGKILSKGKKLIIAINKADLVDKDTLEIEKQRLAKNSRVRVVFVSAKNKDGMNLLRREIGMARGNKAEVVIGLLGYPNSGKSTLINSLSGTGRGKVGTSKRAGFTRGLQRIRIGDGAYLIDAPGIIPYGLKDEFELFMVGAKNSNQLHDVETIALRIIQTFKEPITKKLNLTKTDEEEMLEEIAITRHFLSKGGIADTPKAARWLLERYEQNELGRVWQNTR